MTKPAYMVIRIDVHDPAAMAPYAAGTMPLLEQHDARVVVATNTIKLEDGAWPRGRVVVIEFPSLAKAKAFWNSAEYAPLKTMREATSDADILLVEGMSETRLARDDKAAHYMLGASTSHDDSWVAEYMQKVPPISAKFGVQPLASGSDFEMLDGAWGQSGMVLLRFHSEQVFKDFWFGDEYAPMKALREAGTHGDHVSFPEQVA
jgi:uncharacterized protein (DUF1330 family)